MESPESYLPETFPYEIYSLDDFIHPSTSDQDMIDRLSSFHNQPRKEELERHRLDKPGVSPDQLPSSFFLLSKKLGALMTSEYATLKSTRAEVKALSAELTAMAEFLCRSKGEWSKETMVSIREAAYDLEDELDRCLIGTKTTLEFIPTGAKKAVLGMTKYNMLRPRENSDGLYLDEDVSLCHIFPLEPKKPNRKRQRSGCAAGQFNDVELPPTHEWKEELSNVDMTKSAPLGTEDYSVDVPLRPWDNYTKIYTKDPELIYAACNHCNTMLKLTGGAGCGTKSLINHSKSLKCKKKQQPGSTSPMPTPSIVFDGHHGIPTDGVVEIMVNR